MPAPDLAQLWRDDAALDGEAQASLTRLVQVIAARLQLRRDKPDATARASDEAMIAAGMGAIFASLVLTLEQRLLVREAIEAATPPRKAAHGGHTAAGAPLH